MSNQERLTSGDEIFAIRISAAQNHLLLEQLAEIGLTPEAAAVELAKGPCLWGAKIDQVSVGFAIVREDTACCSSAPTTKGKVWAAYYLSQRSVTSSVLHGHDLKAEKSISFKTQFFYSKTN